MMVFVREHYAGSPQVQFESCGGRYRCFKRHWVLPFRLKTATIIHDRLQQQPSARLLGLQRFTKISSLWRLFEGLKASQHCSRSRHHHHRRRHCPVPSRLLLFTRSSSLSLWPKSHLPPLHQEASLMLPRRLHSPEPFYSVHP